HTTATSHGSNNAGSEYILPEMTSFWFGWWQYQVDDSMTSTCGLIWWPLTKSALVVSREIIIAGRRSGARQASWKKQRFPRSSCSRTLSRWDGAPPGVGSWHDDSLRPGPQ